MTEDSKMESNDYKIVSSAQQNQPKSKKVGQSKFYDVSSCMVASEKQDIMKPEDYIDEGTNYYLSVNHKRYSAEYEISFFIFRNKFLG